MYKDYMLRGDENVFVPSHLNFGKTILGQIRSMGDEVAIENAETGETLTYKQVTQYAVDLSVALTKLGVRRGDVVALGTEKRILVIPTIIGVVMTGATYTPYDLEIGRAVLRHAMSVAKPKFFIYSDKFWNKFSEVLLNFNFETLISLDDVPIMCMVTPAISVKSLTQEHFDVAKFEPIEVQGQIDVALILYSSGTTGMPKGVLLTHLNCLLQFRTFNTKIALLQNHLTTGEWYHSYDITTSFGVLLSRKKLVYTNNVDACTILKGIERSKVNVAYLVPSILNQISKIDGDDGKYNIESLKCFYSAGAPLSTDTGERLKQRFTTLRHVMQMYGCTEAAVMSVASEDQTSLHKPQSVGNLRPGFTVKVVNTATGEMLGPNENGEICFKSSAVMKGYIGVDPSTYLDKEGFFKSGDYGYYDDDGCIFIVSRLKEMIKYDGYPISPVQIENILLQHPAVLEAGVVGKPAYNVEELPTAFIVKQPGVNVPEQELIDYIAKEVSHYMQLRGGVIFVTELPKTPKGKLQRLSLKEMLNKHTY